MAKSTSVGDTKKGGRPSSYKPDYCRQARLLILFFSASDCVVADMFDTTEMTINRWKSEYPEFRAALNPTKEDFDRYNADKKAYRDKINASKRKALSKNPSGRVRNAMSARMWSALKGRKDEALFSKLSYTLDDLIQHLSSLFTEGMTLDNYGKWHIDHIKPCSLYDLTDIEQFNECWSLSNLQPLWASDNIRKGAKYVSP